MKKLLFILSLSFSSVLFAQERNGITYQALIVDPSGEFLPGADNNYSPLKNTSVCLQFHIIDSTNSYEYSEQHTVTTDNFGMVNLVIGTGSAIGGVGWENVSWSASAKSLKVDVDKTGSCSSFEELSNQPLTSVPFALYSPGSDTPGPQGDPGEEGMSAYEVWLDLGNTGTEQDFIDSLKGPEGDPGDPGDPGADGDSAYDLWIAEGNTGTEQEFLDSLTGDDGDSAYDIWIAAGNTGTEQEFLDSLKATDGNDGDSAYDIWIAAGNTGTEQEFLDSLKATDGNDGDSAYDIWIAAGNTGTAQEFLDSLKGQKGDPGQDGVSSIDNSLFSESSLINEYLVESFNQYSNPILSYDGNYLYTGDYMYNITSSGTYNNNGSLSLYEFNSSRLKKVFTTIGDDFSTTGVVKFLGKNVVQHQYLNGDATKIAISYSGDNINYLKIFSFDHTTNLLTEIQTLNKGSTNFDGIHFNYSGESFIMQKNNSAPSDSFTEYTLNNGTYQVSSSWSGTGKRGRIKINHQGNTAIVSNNYDAAGLYVLKKNGTSWSQQGQTLNDNIGEFGLGWTFDISSDGNTIAYTEEKMIGTGSTRSWESNVKVYEYNGSIWEQKGLALSFKERIKDIKLDNLGTILLVGTYLEPESQSDSTKDDKLISYLFEGNDWNQLGGIMRFDGIKSFDLENGTLVVSNRDLSSLANDGSYADPSGGYTLLMKKLY
jgi:hypothetical protein